MGFTPETQGLMTTACVASTPEIITQPVLLGLYSNGLPGPQLLVCPPSKPCVLDSLPKKTVAGTLSGNKYSNIAKSTTDDPR